MRRFSQVKPNTERQPPPATCFPPLIRLQGKFLGDADGLDKKARL